MLDAARTFVLTSLGVLVVASMTSGCGGASEAPRPAGPASASATVATPPQAVVVVDRTTPGPRPTAQPSARPGEDGACDPFRDLFDRKERDLHVAARPPASTSTIAGRMRSHSDGALSGGSPREWVGPPVPRFVPLHVDTAELHLLETTPQGFVAAYRDPYDVGSCALGDSATNCTFVIAGYERCGKKLWQYDLARHVSRPDHLEIQDVRVADGVVYFNEACQSYARAAGGNCSSLVAFDPVQGKVLWRTKPLVSNNRFLVAGKLLIAGYGFSGESDAVFLVRRSDGKVLARAPLPMRHQDLAFDSDGTLVVTVYPGDAARRFRIDGADGDAPRLVALGAAAPMKGPR